MTNLVLSLVVALGALYAADHAGWLPERGAAAARSDTTREVEIAAPIAPAAVPLPEPALEEELAALAPPFEGVRLEPDPLPEPAPRIEGDAAPPLPELAQQDRSAALVRRMLSLYRRGGEQR